MAVCPTCNVNYEPTVRICPADGTPLPMAPVADPNLGTMLEGKYRIDSFISSGGMGAVYRGTHVMLDKTVAIKLIKKELVTTPDIGARFQREARAASNLGHPNIAAVSDFGQTADGTLYLVMEFIKGPSLRDVIHQGGPMDTARIVGILQPIASALARAHRQHIIHRDLKPHNIMLDENADGGVTPKLLDFGIAKTFDESASQLTMTGFALGTPQYMSPEQATGKQVDGRSDLYSLGIVLYEMLIGEVPFSDTSLAGVLLKQMTETPIAPSLRRPDLAISPVLEAVAMRCLEKDPEHRFQTAEELHAALEQAKGAVATEASTVRMGVVAPPPDNDPTVVVSRKNVAAPTHVTQPGAAAPPPLPPPPPMPAPAAKATVATMAAPLAPVAAVESAAAPKKTGVNIWVPVAAGVALLALVVGALGLRRTSTPATTESTSLEAVSASTPTGATTPASSGMPAPGAPSTPVPAAGTTRAATTAPADRPPTSAPAAIPAAAPQAAAVPATERSSATVPAATSSPAATAPASGVRPVQAPPSVPENPSVFVQCSGPGEVCGPMRAAFGAAASQDHMTLAGAPGRADVVLSIGVEILDERATQSFGTTFVTRSYSAQVEGEAKGNAVPMPAGRTFSFDATVGRERAAENARVLASDTIDKVREFWDRQKR